MPFARILCVAATCASLTLAATAAADQTVAPTVIRPPSMVRLTAPWLTTLRRAAATGDGPRLVQAAFEALDDLRRAGIGEGCCDPASDYFLVTFVGANPDGSPVLITVLAHNPMPTSSELPGIDGAGHPLYAVFLSDDVTSALHATYAITHEESPAGRQAGDFAAAVIGHLALPLAVRSAAPPAAQAGVFDVAVAFGRVVLPETGTITLHQTVTSDYPMGHLASRIASVARDEQAAFRDGADPAGPACAAFSAILKGGMDATMASGACGPWPADLTACAKTLRDDLAQAAAAYFAASPACPPAAAAPVVQVFLAAVDDVKPVTATIVIGNAALTRYGFGLAAAYVARIAIDDSHPRARLQGGRIVADAFPRELTMGVVNLSPWGYDSQRQTSSLAERARLVAGVAFSPYFGLTAGAALEITRSLAVNAGYARLWFDTPRPGEQIGGPPASASQAAPFELRSTGALFVGVWYNFK